MTANRKTIKHTMTPQEVWGGNKDFILESIARYFKQKVANSEHGHILFGLWLVNKKKQSYQAKHASSGCSVNQALSRKWNGATIDYIQFDSIWGGISGTASFIDMVDELSNIKVPSIHGDTKYPSVYWSHFCRSMIELFLKSAATQSKVPGWGVFTPAPAQRTINNELSVVGYYLIWEIMDDLWLVDIKE
jgi:hypothetical protein